MKTNDLCRVTFVVATLVATPVGAQSIKIKESRLTPAQQLQQIGTFSARTPVGTDLARKPSAQLARPNEKPNTQSRQRAVVRGRQIELQKR